MSAAHAQGGIWEAAFEAMAERRSGEPGWLAQRRREAFERFCALGLPTQGLEAWEYTSTKAIVDTGFSIDLGEGGADDQVTAEAIAQVRFGGLDSLALVFVDGCFRADLSDERVSGAAYVGPLSGALAAEGEGLESTLGRIAEDASRAFVALNTALFTEGALIRVPRNTTLDKPVHLIFVATESSQGARPVASTLRNLILVERGAEATVIESHAGPASGPHLRNVLTEVHVAEGARLRCARLQNEGPDAIAIHNLDAHIARDARLSAYQLALGGQLVRNEVWATLQGPGGECVLGGVYPLTARQHVDNFTHVDHAAPHCQSRQLYKGLLHGRSRGVFQGKVLVRQVAQKTNANQSNPNLLLSPGAVADTKPQLEIYADDVRCTHGATVGKLSENPDQLFYLRSRGMTLHDARQLLLRAFAFEVIAEIEGELGSGPVSERFEALLEAKIARFDIQGDTP